MVAQDNQPRAAAIGRSATLALVAVMLSGCLSFALDTPHFEPPTKPSCAQPYGRIAADLVIGGVVAWAGASAIAGANDDERNINFDTSDLEETAGIVLLVASGISVLSAALGGASNVRQCREAKREYQRWRQDPAGWATRSSLPAAAP